MAGRITFNKEMIMRSAILNRLKSAPDYLSGEQLSRELDVSRAAINKHIMALRQMGYPIESITNRGYRLLAHNLFNQLELDGLIARGGYPVTGQFYDTIDSTNQAAKQVHQPSLIVALEQTKGRGRRGRDWVSHKGQGLYFSLALMPQLPPDVISAITQLAGLCVARAIGPGAQIKWPNDVLIEGKKVSGILTELVTQADLIEKLIIGIGVNFQPVADMATATSLSQAGLDLSLSDFLTRFLDQFFGVYPDFLARPTLAQWLEEINQRSFLQAKTVRIDGSDETGQFIGIDEQGRALVEGTKLHQLSYGEISLVGWR